MHTVTTEKMIREMDADELHEFMYGDAHPTAAQFALAQRQYALITDEAYNYQNND